MREAKRRYVPYQSRRCIKTQVCRLFGFQRRAICWILERYRLSKQKNDFSGVLVNVDWGLGKTIMGLFSAARLGWNVLYICPTDVVSHVELEVRKHFGAGVRVHVANSWDELWWRVHQYDITIVSYYTMSRIKPEDAVSKKHIFRTCIVDEIATCDKEKRWNKLIDADFFIGLTACQKPELQTLLPLIGAKSWKHVFTFRQPPSFEHETVFVTMSPDVRTQYETIKDQIQSGNLSESKCQKLLHDSIALLSLDKTTELRRLLETKVPPGFKVFVVSNFSQTLRTLRQSSPKLKTLSVLLDSKVKGREERQKRIDQFQTDDHIMFLFASLAIVYCGIDLGFVDILVIVDPPFKAMDKLELQGRLRRCGQRPKYVRLQYVIEIVTRDCSDFRLFSNNKNKIELLKKT